jgi:hypothetical protein
MARCLLSGAYPSSVVSEVGKPSTNTRALVIGKIFHSQMEFLNGLTSAGNLSPAEFRKGFNTTLEGIARDVERDPASKHLGDIRLWPELSQIYSSLRALFDYYRGSGDGKRETHPEETLYSKDKLLFGQLDAFFLDQSGIDLVDYKSGAMTDGESPKEDYVRQLYFYAYLLTENYDQYPRKITLIGRNLHAVDLPLSRQQSDAIAQDMRDTLNRYNDAISRAASPEAIAKPSVENCKYCDAKAVCSSFWNVAKDMELPERGHAVIGTQSSPITTSRRGVSWLTLDLEEGSIQADRLTVSRFDADRYPHIKDQVGQRLMMLNIRLINSQSPAVAETTDRTIILRMDD